MTQTDSTLPLIRDCMATDLTQFSAETEIMHAMAVLLKKNLSGAPITDRQGQLVGVLSKKDCLKAALNACYYQEFGGAVSDYMSTKIETLDADLDIVQAAEAFLASSFRRFPVVENGVLIGQVSRSDILSALSDQWV